MDVGRTDVAPDCVAAGSIFERSALVKALVVSPLVREREVGCQQRLNVITLGLLLLFSQTLAAAEAMQKQNVSETSALLRTKGKKRRAAEKQGELPDRVTLRGPRSHISEMSND